MISSGELDLAFSGLTPQMPADMKSRLLLDEQLFFVISDNMLRRYRPDYLPALHNSENIADLRDFRLVPVCRSLPNLHCMEILDTVLDSLHVSLNCVHVSGHFDLHLELAVRDYAACFCLGMYLSHLERINECSENKLHVFRIKGLSDTNPVFLLQKVCKRLTICTVWLKMCLFGFWRKSAGKLPDTRMTYLEVLQRIQEDCDAVSDR